MQFCRIYTGEDGKSHFEDLDQSEGSKHFLRSLPVKALVFKNDMNRDDLHGWHPAPRRQWCITLSGTVEIAGKIIVVLIRQYHEFRVRDSLGQDVRRHAMAHHDFRIAFFFSDDDQSLCPDVFEPSAGIMCLPSEHMTQIRFHRTKIC